MLSRIQKNARSFIRSNESVPQHIAFIMDGNRRFAQKKGYDTKFGHETGMTAMENILHWTYLAKIKHITVYAFSTENFKRDKEEIDNIFFLLEKALNHVSNDERILRKKIKIRLIGETDKLPKSTLEAFRKLEVQTAENTNMCLNVAVAYGGQSDIVQAFEKIASKTAAGENIPLTDKEISKYLFPFTDETIPGVDFLIRTGEEYRTSNFLPWQANGNNAVVCFYDKFWPEFTFKDLFYVLRKYQKIEQERRLKNEKRLKKVNAFLEKQNEEAE